MTSHVWKISVQDECAKNVSTERRKQCFVRHDGRSIDIADYPEVSNYLKLRWSKAMVVSVKEKACKRQVRFEEMNESELYDEVSKRRKDDVKIWGSHPFQR